MKTPFLSWRAFRLVLLATTCGATSLGASAQSALGARAGPSSETARGRGPDVLLILADDFAWSDLEEVDTPNLDRLARKGMTFRRAYTWPVCSTTRYATMFGRYGRRDGIGALIQSYEPPSDVNPTPDLGLVSLPEIFRRRGHRTAMFGKWHLGSNRYQGVVDPAEIEPLDIVALTPLLHGFQTWRAGAMANFSGPGGVSYRNWLRVDDGVFSDSHEYEPQAVLDEFLDWWPGGRGRFAYVALHLAHAPYHDPPPGLLPPGYPVGSFFLRDRFEAMIASVDFIVGIMLAEVDLRETFVFFLTDNGTPFAVSSDTVDPDAVDKGKGTIYERGINMPLIVAGPGVPAGTESRSLVSAIDLMATFADLLGVPSPGEDSRSFRATLRDPSVESRRFVYSDFFNAVDAGNDHLFAAVGRRYKLHRIESSPARGAVELLFDLELDPAEEHPLDLSDPGHAAVLADLRAVIADPFDPPD